MMLLQYGCMPTTVKEPVWTPPKVDIPARPILSSDGTGSDGQQVRKVEDDMIQMREYAFKLENIINSLGTQNNQQ